MDDYLEARKKADVQNVLCDLRAHMYRRGFPQARPKDTDWANLDRAEEHREALKRYFDAEAERLAAWNSVKDKSGEADKEAVQALQGEEHRQAVVDQMVVFCTHYGRQPSLPPRAYTVEALVVQEVALFLRYKKVRPQISAAQKDQIKEACLGKGDFEIVAALEHLQKYTNIGNSHESTRRIEGGRVLSKQDCGDIRDLLQLRWPLLKADLTRVAKKFRRTRDWHLARLPEDADDERTEDQVADSKPKGKRHFNYSTQRWAYWCRSGVCGASQSCVLVCGSRRHIKWNTS